MKNKIIKGLTYTGMAIVFALAVYAAGWLATYKFRDCKKVGHSTFYCIMDMGK